MSNMNAKESIVRRVLRRNMEYLKSSKDLNDLIHRHGLCRGSARTFFDLGYIRSPEYRDILFDINQTYSELEHKLPDKYTGTHAV